jgi:hypothetical protein
MLVPSRLARGPFFQQRPLCDLFSASLERQGIDLREKRVEKVITDAIGLPFVELPCRSEIL